MSDVGKFRVRRSWFGKCILQRCVDTPAFIAGRVDSTIRVHYWSDVKYDKAPGLLIKENDNG